METKDIKDVQRISKRSTVVLSPTIHKVWNVVVGKNLQKETKVWRGIALMLFGLLILLQTFTIRIEPKFTLIKRVNTRNISTAQTSNKTDAASKTANASIDASALQKVVLPTEGVVLPIFWGDIGKKMVKDGVIDDQKFRALFEGGLQNVEETMLSGSVNGPIVMNEQNSRYMLDILWAFGLANKNPILENGEMTDKQYGGAGNFASTGGWTLSNGKAMDHYSKHAYVPLTKDQQDLVDRVSSNIYRPCCGNSTHFPDCNHGMAMLGLLQLLAANGVSEKDMYKIALVVNSYWFPQTYIDLAMYFKEQGKEWQNIDPQVALGTQYSSAKGYQETRSKIQSLPQPKQGGGGCGV
ncbi:MAG TPA: hypothetical protein DCX25_00790 [Candidatus Pacebacteria bacterium]|nr:MAG: hypothetical protein UX00_C0017G0009 [Microgenomates group bacterium GW2011_GWB1_45_17]KKU23197.1 MAG: hypothetical protein UX35_C0009G0021 [Microgenomates group bacterium GW2011_GWA1_46_15]KKU24055.1 MAG: hypothetical protein UX36_C0002G0038 [Microgenomates group bacterium GW2011_GWC1_46_15]HAV14856.1 hypothetical protein [Candidatus Paceibacterota bacterium]HCR11247.1 hypothetical protein [Candidatus Paceibacterota bacterium]